MTRRGATKPLRVAHLIAGLEVGGAEQMLAKLVTSLDPGRVESLVISISEPGPIGQLLESEGIQVVALGLRMGVPSLRTPGKVARTLRRWRADALQTWLYHADVMGGMAGWLTRTPVIWNVRQTDLGGATTRRITQLAALVCSTWSSWLPDRVSCVSHATLASHTAIGYDASKMVVMPNGFDTTALRPDTEARASVRAELGLAPSAKLIGHVARFDPAKGHANLLAAVRQLPPDVHVLMCGRGIDAGNEQLARLRPPANVHLLGPRTDIPRLTAALDLAASPSVSEGFSNAIGEAMACGVPVVATDVGDSARVVADTGRIVAPNDPQALAAAIRQLLADDELRADLGRRARARVMHEYSLAAIVDRYEQLWRDVADRRRVSS